MRTTLTLDADVASRLKALMKKRDITLKQAVNEIMRRGLQVMSAEPEPPPFVVVPHDLGGFLPGIDPTKLGQLDDELQVEGALGRMK